MAMVYDLGPILFTNLLFKDFAIILLPFSRSLNWQIYPGLDLRSTSLPQPMVVIYFILHTLGVPPTLISSFFWSTFPPKHADLRHVFSWIQWSKSTSLLPEFAKIYPCATQIYSEVPSYEPSNLPPPVNLGYGLRDFTTWGLLLSYSSVHFQIIKTHAIHLDPMLVGPLHPDPTAGICSPLQSAPPSSWTLI
jgi:hypothetical protein